MTVKVNQYNTSVTVIQLHRMKKTETVEVQDDEGVYVCINARKDELKIFGSEGSDSETEYWGQKLDKPIRKSPCILANNDRNKSSQQANNNAVALLSVRTTDEVMPGINQFSRKSLPIFLKKMVT